MVNLSLNCSPGDIVEFKMDAPISAWPDEMPNIVQQGSRYRVVELVGEGWELERLSGFGPKFIRVLNSDIPKYLLVTH